MKVKGKMKDKTPQFYYRGIYYTNEIDFWKGVYEFNDSPISEESIEDFLNDFKANLQMNIGRAIPKMSNKTFRQRLENIFFYSIEEFNKVENEGKS